MSDLTAFQKSITDELEVIKNRVRNLIDNRHWGEEGRFKEIILKNVLRRFLPSNLSVGTGFIIKLNENNEKLVSKQLDIIIYDNNLPVLFLEGDFVITTHTNVRGIIEVKSKLNPSKLNEAIQQFDTSIEDFISDLQQSNKKVFTGIFSYEFEGDYNSSIIEDALKNSKKLINHISLGKDLFVRYWQKDDGINLNPPIQSDTDFYNLYNITGLSFSYFISNIIDITSGGLNDRQWFLYPITGTKETNRITTITLN